MGQTISEQRWAENEVIFRQRNKALTDNIAANRAIADEEGLPAAEDIDDIKLLFYCECADETCHQRISLTPNEYEQQHRNRSQFLLVPGHHLPQIERVMRDEGDYIIVEKFITPPSKVEQLRTTK